MDLPICPITGKPCTMPRSYSVTDIDKDGKVKSISLCTLCAQDHLKAKDEDDVIISPIVSLPDYTEKNKSDNPKEAFKSVVHLVNFLDDIRDMSKKRPKSGSCPSCKSTLEDIAKTERLGCPSCYDHFGALLDPLLSKIQNVEEVKHVGKVPKNWEKRQKEKKEKRVKSKKALEALMQQAIDEENYEEAALLRDEIKKIVPAERIDGD